MFKRIALPLLLAGLIATSVTASATAAGTGWELTANSFPTRLQPGGGGLISIGVFNVGAQGSSGVVTVTDTLPEGLIATAAGTFNQTKIERRSWVCGGVGTRVVTCTNNNPGGEPISIPGGGLGPGSGGPIEHIGIAVTVAPTAAGEAVNRVVIGGGGALNTASTAEPVVYSSTLPGFGFADFDVWFSNADGTIDTQAGSHPYAATFAFTVNNEVSTEGGSRTIYPTGGELRNISVNLPPGFVGNPNATPHCTREELDREACPPDSQVGIQAVSPNIYGGTFINFPIYNMVPPRDVAAEFASIILGIITTYDSGVRSGAEGGYGITTHVDNTPQKAIVSSITTLWGVPGDPSHASERQCESRPCRYGGVSQPLLTLPTACAGPQEFSIRSNTWQHADVFGEARSVTHDSNGAPTGFTGCEDLSFAPSISLAPDTAAADTPAGLTAVVEPTLGGLEVPGGLSTADIRNTVVTLPEGVAINPGQAAGLQACPFADDGLAPLPDGEENNGPPSCPAASKVGTVKIKTPLLEGSFESELEGDVYILPSNPPNLKILLAASGDGVHLKLIGDVHLNERTGQLTTTFSETPGLPFNHFRLSFSGGAQAALATPVSCGVYTSSADFSPWSGFSDVFASSSFGVETGTGGAPCAPSPLPYTPEMIAGSTTDQAGGYTDFSLLLQVPDDQQRTTRLQFKTPEGLLGMISKVSLCTDAQAETNSCPATSQIGHTVVQSGPGPYPLVVPQPGQPPAPIYLTEGYGGGNYGLSIVVPLHVGPFELPTQRVRAKIEVDPLTSQLTITTDPLPQYVAGVPTDLRTINAVIDKPGFMFNPTGCDPRSFSGTAYGGEGAQAPISSHFQMGSCRALLFQPNFKVSTSAHTSRQGGASLGVKIVYPSGELGANQASSQSNIQTVKVELPKRLPSRLTTLQKACTAAHFNANPAGCPAASVVGHVTVHTPVLPVPLTGPAYFVSNGSEAFPNLIMVVQGYGVTIHLIGNTFISKQGITSSTFKQVPDVPIQSFELNLPQGPYSALAANGNLCKGKLVMPTDFVAQNGAVLDQRTQITVTGCAKHKAKRALKAAHKGRRHRARSRRGRR